MRSILTLWLPEDIFTWNATSSGGHYFVSSKLIQRSYTIWEHSKTLIEESTNDLQLSDGILNLKRSFNQRLKLIEDIYSFKSIEISNKPKGYLELLEKYGIVRPYLMTKLLSIRNDIEHNDAPPPNINKCKELLDVVWYFLKSTDSIVKIVNNANFDLLDDLDEETQYGFEANIDYDSRPLTIKLNGWFPDDIISTTIKPHYFRIIVEVFHDKQDWGSHEHHKERIDTDKWIIAAIDTRTIQLEKIINKIMIAY
jgi:hypothetical protein